MIDDDELDDFQAALTALMARQLPASETARILATDPAFAAHRAWTDTFDLRLIEAASMLAANWARRD